MPSESIELELPEEEVDIHEADVLQDPPADRNVVTAVEEESTPEEVAAPTELDEYSDSVKKRINRLTYQMREAERQRDEAVDYAQRVQTQNSTLQTRLRSSDGSLVKEYDNRVNSELARAKNALKEAQELGDGEAIAQATEAVARSATEAENVKRLQAQQVRARRNTAQSPPQMPPQQQQQAIPPDPKAQDWAEQNEWFGTDQAMTYAAFGIHRDLVEEGQDPTSNGYYTEVDKRIREYFPQKFGQTEIVQQRVAGSSRGTGGKRATRSVKLNPSQVAIAKRLGVPLEDYARHVEN
jgi:hypothetical protein